MAQVLAEPTQKLNVDHAKLQEQMRDLLSYAQETHSALFADIPVFWDWYYARPADKTKNTPFQNACNLVYPLIRSHVDQIHAQRHDSLTATPRVWVHETDNEDSDLADEMGRQAAKYINDEGGVQRTFDLAGTIYDVTRESEILNESVFRLRWGPKERWRFGPSRGGKPQLRKVRISHGPVLEHVPRQNIMWQPGSSIEESPWIIRKVALHRAEIEELSRALGWNPTATQKLLKTTPQLPALNGNFETRGLTPIAASKLFAPYCLYEVQIEFPMTQGIQPLENPEAPGSKTYPPILAWLTDQGELLYVGTYPYPTEGWNYYCFTRSGSGKDTHDQGLAETLEHTQRGLTTMLCQAIDAVTLHNNILGLTRDRSVIGRPIVPGQFLLCEDLEGVRFDMKPPHIIQPNIQVMQVLFAAAERLTGQSDPGFGRESRLGGHPSPATNLLAMLQQGSLKLKTVLKKDRATLTRLGQDLKAFYESYGAAAVDPARLARRYGQADAAVLLRWLQPQSEEDLAEFTLRAVDDSLNPETQFQKQVLIDQLAASYIARVLEAMQNIPQAAQQFPELGQALAQAIQIFTESYKRILEAASIDDPETFILRIQGLEDASRQSIDRLGETATSALANLSANNPAAGIPAVPTGAPV